MTRPERTSKLFADQGLFCSQAILTVYGEPYGVSPEQAKCIGRTFCGMISSRGWEACGYVMGGLIALAHQHNGPDEKEAREATKKAAFTFLEKVKEKYGSIKCKDLLGVDMATEEGRQKVQEEKLTAQICPSLGLEIATILEGVVDGSVLTT